MLPKKNRVPRYLFETIFKSGSRKHSTFFYLRTIDTEKGGFNFSVVVPKKTLKGSVNRNRLKRRVYAVLEEFFTSLRPVSGILFAKKGADELDSEQLKEEIKILLASSEVLNGRG